MKKDFKIDFIGIGAEKSASTWIYRCLQEHAQLYLLPKDNAIGAYFLDPSNTKEKERSYRFFLSLAKPGQLKGEFNNLYLRRQGAPERIKAHNPEIKLIACLRNPITRAYSAYVHHYTLTNEEWIPLKKATEVLPNEISEPGFYYKYLKRFFALFPKENILILIYEDIAKDPVRFIQEIYRFLGVDDTFAPHKARVKVATADFKLTKLGQFVHKRITPLFKKSKLGWKLNESALVGKYFYRFADFYTRKGKSSANIDRETRNYLLNLYRQDIKNLEKLINRNLSFWR